MTEKFKRGSIILALWLGFILTLSLNSCGYHLVGHGDGSHGVIPDEVQAISLVGNADTQLLAQLHRRLQSDHYAIVDADTVDAATPHAMLHINIAALRFIPSAFDASGLATQYRMFFTGSLLLEQQGKTIWQSGQLQRQGDVFVTGSPASIEAARERLLADLQKQWLSDAVGRMRSGF
ncbi:MAG: adenosylmethionine-8-amino-7-oxononanoate aminotransferase [Mariprofundus sp.]|nr:adenosylmethionine-8-amino-7-oxononanoate aminotransferase [Mariprofundus sp.]